MVVSDAENVVTNLDVDCGGSFHDQMVFRGTPLYGILERGDWLPFENAIIAADSGYETKKVFINQKCVVILKYMSTITTVANVQFRGKSNTQGGQI